MRNDTLMDDPVPLAEGTRPVPADETGDTGTLLCPTLPPDLHYVDDSQPGIRRRRLRGKFVYFEPNGERIRDEEEIRRINKLAIPPAYRDVWICPDAQGHLQATGRDARGRKQYRYHTRWREIRDSTSTNECSSSVKPCRNCAAIWKNTWLDPAWRVRRSWPW